MKASANAQRASAYTPNMETPSGSRRAKRGPFCLALTLLIPPLGLLFLWRNGVFRTRGRMLLTVVATIEMAVIFTIAMPKPELYTSLPVPVVPLAVTPAPKDDVVTALSNIDQLLAAQQAENAMLNGEEDVQATITAEERARLEAEQEAILNTTVYCYYGSGTRFYHAREVCGTQSNRRMLTVREALAEYLGACPDCNPPAYTGVPW